MDTAKGMAKDMAAGLLNKIKGPNAGPPHFQTGLFDTFKEFCSPLWIEGCCCAYCQTSHQFNMVENGIPKMDLMWFLVPCLIDGCTKAGIIGFAINYYMRTKMIQLYGIQEDPLYTLAALAIFGPCAQCQQHKEMTLRGQFPGGIIASKPIEGLAPTVKSMGAPPPPGKPVEAAL